MKHMNMTKTRW